MRRPMDFWKAMFLAQAFITIVYIFFGAFVSAAYGKKVADLKSNKRRRSTLITDSIATLSSLKWFNRLPSRSSTTCSGW